MVRGSVLELMDHNFDGHEDSQTGDLRGGLGQLVDGRYGGEIFKSGGDSGFGRGKVDLIQCVDSVRKRKSTNWTSLGMQMPFTSQDKKTRCLVQCSFTLFFVRL